jgi:hypothetical protein
MGNFNAYKQSKFIFYDALVHHHVCSYMQDIVAFGELSNAVGIFYTITENYF